MKNMKRKLKCVVALILCMSMVFGTNLSTLADGNEAGTKQVQAKQAEAEAADAAEASEAKEKDAAAQSAEQTAETLKQQEKQSSPETAEGTEAAEPQKQETEGTKPQAAEVTDETEKETVDMEDAGKREGMESDTEADRKRWKSETKNGTINEIDFEGKKLQTSKDKILENIDKRNTVNNEKEYPVYSSSQDMGQNYKNHDAKEFFPGSPEWGYMDKDTIGSGRYDMRWDSEEQKWKCGWHDDKAVGGTEYGTRDKHYIHITDSTEPFALCYIRCDMYRGEIEEKIYFPVFYINADTKEPYLIDGRIWESVLQGEKPKQVPKDLGNGKWTLAEQVDENITESEQLKKVVDSQKEVIPSDEEIDKQTVFIWHPEKSSVSIYFEKIDENNQPLANVEFTIYQNNQEKGKATSDDKGKVNFDTALEAGEYILQETKTPDGYKIPNEKWTLKVEEDDFAISGQNVSVQSNGTYVIKNELKPIKERIKVNKSVKVENYNNRTYIITLEVEALINRNETVDIKDVIDSRFGFVEMVNNNPKPSKENNVLTWKNVTIPANGKWTASFIIKAKDDFIGGNMIPTNGNESKVSQGKETVYFPKPTVNVKLLDLSVEDKEETVFLGDMIYSDGDQKSNKKAFVDQLLETLKFKNEKEILGLNTKSISWGESNDPKKKTFSMEYSYLGTNDTVGTFRFEFSTNDGSLENHEAEKTGKPAETYTLKVTYQAKTVKEREDGLTDYEKPIGKNQSSTTVSGTYKVHVVAGEIKITKKIAGETKHHLDGDLTFIFKIDRKENGKTIQTWYRAVKMGKDDTDVATELLTDLPRGEYTITELDTIKYDLKSIETSKDNECETKKGKDGKSITVSIGTGMPNVEKLIQTGQTSIPAKGCVTFTNKRTDSGKKTDSDVMLNRFTRIKPEKPGKPGKPGWKHEEIGEPQSKQQ